MIEWMRRIWAVNSFGEEGTKMISEELKSNNQSFSWKCKFKISAPPSSGKEDKNDDDDDVDEMRDGDDMTEAADRKEKALKGVEKALLACCSSGMKRGLPRILHADGIPALFDSDGAKLRSTIEFELHHFDPDSDRVNVEPFVNAKTGASTERHTEIIGSRL